MKGSEQQTSFFTNERIALFSLIFAILSFGVAVVAYVRPPDPAHPLRFDWLSRTVSVPLWLLGVVIVGIASATRAMFRPRLVKSVDEIKRVSQGPVPSTIATSTHTLGAPAPANDQTVDPPFVENGRGNGDETFEMQSPDHYSARIQKHSWEKTRGLAIIISNERLSWIAKYKITIHTAQSFDYRHQEYRDGLAFKPVIIQKPVQIEPSGIGKAIWLLRSDGSKDGLYVGEDNVAPLKWPAGDLSTTHKWKFTATVYAEAITQPTSEMRALTPIDFGFSVMWDTVNRDFSLDKIYSYQQLP